MYQVRRRYAMLLAALSLIAARARGAQLATAPQFEGRVIANISFDPQRQPLDPDQIYSILPVRAGEPYRSAKIRAAIERLYSTGRYRNIEVDAESANGGVALRFITQPTWFIGYVTAEGDFSDPPSTGQIVSASRLNLGQHFSESALKPAEQAIRTLLVDNGYFGATVSHRLDYRDRANQVNITFLIDGGRRAQYSNPVIQGDTSALTANQIAAATRWRRFLLPGYRDVSQSRTRHGINDIRLRYQAANRLLATVVLDSMKPEDNGRRATPVITVDPGPVVDIQTRGAKLSRGALKTNVPIFEEHAIDPDLLAEGAGNLRDYFQARGYFDVSVQFRHSRTSAERVEIDYEIETGPRHRFVHIGLVGNRYFEARQIRERMLLTPASLEFRHGRYSEAYRRRDEDSIAELYRANGFQDVQVSSKVIDDYKGHKTDVAAIFTISEGPQYLVASLKVTGAEHLTLANIIRSLSSQQGQPFSEYNVAEDRAAILREYGNAGFPNARFEWSSNPAAPPHTVNLQFAIDEGPRQFVREVITTGLHTTRPRLVDKQIELNPGNPLSPEKMEDTQRRLYDLGIFAQVNMAVQNPDGDESQKYVLYDLEEASRYSLTTGFGLEFARIGGSTAVTDLSDPGGAPGLSPRVSVGLTRLNFLGLGQSISLQGRLSTLQKRTLLNYYVPRIFRKPNLDATFSLLYDDTNLVRTFRARREEVAAQVAQHFSKSITMFYRFTYRDSVASALKIDPLLVPRLAQSVRVGMASFNLIQDRRDDPIDPHTGIYNTVDLGFATRAFGSQASFGRVLGRNATYYRLGPKLVLARETQIGIEPAFSISPTADPTDPVPLPERFYGGGGNTMRGFPENQAGPRDLLTGFPLGGSALFFNNTELRFPLYGPNINGVLFEDAGNIYSSLGKISFRTTQRNISDFDYMVHAVGFGVRYRTPVGPVRVDLAYSINPPRYNGFPGNYNQLVACSAAATCQPQPLQINHLQFFFSIGQAF